MLAHLQRRLAALLAEPTHVTLASDGPAGVQACVVRSVVDGLRLLLLVPDTSDQLLNLEAGHAVVVASAQWQAYGEAHVLTNAERLTALSLLPVAHAAWYAMVEVRPTRVTINHPEGWGAVETIDLEPTRQAPIRGQGASHDGANPV